MVVDVLAFVEVALKAYVESAEGKYGSVLVSLVEFLSVLNSRGELVCHCGTNQGTLLEEPVANFARHPQAFCAAAY